MVVASRGDSSKWAKSMFSFVILEKTKVVPNAQFFAILYSYPYYFQWFTSFQHKLMTYRPKLWHFHHRVLLLVFSSYITVHYWFYAIRLTKMLNFDSSTNITYYPKLESLLTCSLTKFKRKAWFFLCINGSFRATLLVKSIFS